MNRRAFLHSLGIVVVGVAAEPYVRKLWPGWGAGLTHRPLHAVSQVYYRPTPMGDLDRMLREAYRPLDNAVFVADTEGVFEARTTLDTSFRGGPVIMLRS